MDDLLSHVTNLLAFLKIKQIKLKRMAPNQPSKSCEFLLIYNLIHLNTKNPPAFYDLFPLTKLSF